MKLDIGCGEFKQAGFTGVDIIDGENVDIVGDLHKLPIDSGTVDEVYSSHLLEHVEVRNEPFLLHC